MTYDPEEKGARCSVCPLGPNGCMRGSDEDWTPIRSEIHPDAAIAAVVESPRLTDVVRRQLLSDSAGGEWREALAAAGLRRTQVSVIPVTACRPPGKATGAWKRMEAQLTRRRKELKKDLAARGLTKQEVEHALDEMLPHPADCCRPRMLSELINYAYIYALGPTASKQVLETNKSMGHLEGDMLTYPASRLFFDVFDHRWEDWKVKVIPTFAPGYISHKPAMKPQFHSTMAKGLRFFNDALRWLEPEIVEQPTPQELRDWLAEPAPFWVYDLETSGIEPMHVDVWCIAIATPDMVGDRLAMPWEKPTKLARTIGINIKDGRNPHRYYNYGVEEEIKDILRDLMLDESKVKAGHNCLHTSTPVILGDGTSVPIDRLVRSKYAGTVKALDQGGNIVEARVTGWFRQRDPETKWLVIRREGEKRHARGLTLTPDHEVYTTRGRVRADALRVGDQILVGESALTEEQRQALLGTLLGDSSLVCVRTVPSAKGFKSRRATLDEVSAVGFRGGHTDPELVREKVECLEGHLAMKKPYTGASYKADSRMYPYGSTRSSQYLGVARLAYNEDSTRRIGRDTLEALGAVGWAWWFMDDGFRHRRSANRRDALLLSLCRYSDEARQVVMDYCEEHFGQVSLMKNGAMRFSADASEVFAKHIAPYVFETARYKLLEDVAREVPFVGFAAAGLRPHARAIESIEPYTVPAEKSRSRQLQETRWCLQTTEGNFLTGFGFVKNCGSYDHQVIMSWLGVRPVNIHDTLLEARLAHPDIPKGLKPTGRRLTDVHKWETNESGEKNSSGAVTGEERLRYCEYDTVVNARIYAPLRAAADENNAAKPLPEWAKPVSWPSHVPWDLRNLDHARQQMCVDLHQNGVYVDQAKRLDLEVKFTKVAGALYNRLQDLSQAVGLSRLDQASVEDDDDVRDELDEFKPGSYDQIRELLYNTWRLGKPYGMDAKDFYTDTGLPGTGDAVLRAHMSNPDLTMAQKDFLLCLRQYRRVQTKVLGTQLKVMRPERDGGKVHDDGRVRSTWNSHVTAVGRLSSSGPNMQNQSSRKDLGGVRSIYRAAPGNVLVGCDLDSAHLVITANYWRIERLLQCFREHKDPHCWLAHDIFGTDFEVAGGWGARGFSLLKANKPAKKKPAGQMRELIKNYRYGSIYGANAVTKHGLIIATEFTALEGKKVYPGTDAPVLTTKLPYLDFSLQQVRFFDMMWHEREPDWRLAWDQMMGLYEKQGYMEDPLFSRRSGPLSGGKLNEVVNFPIIACEAAIMSIAEQRVLEVFPHQKWGPGTGMVAQVHDSIVIEVPEHLGEWARDEMTRLMTIEVPGWEVPFTCEADLGYTWAEV